MAGTHGPIPAYEAAKTQTYFYKVYDSIKEYTRLGLVPSSWFRVTSVNSDYELTPSYPALFVVPAAVNDTELRIAAAFRSKGR